jgi:hypothetical protein
MSIANEPEEIGPLALSIISGFVQPLHQIERGFAEYRTRPGKKSGRSAQSRNGADDLAAISLILCQRGDGDTTLT